MFSLLEFKQSNLSLRWIQPKKSRDIAPVLNQMCGKLKRYIDLLISVQCHVHTIRYIELEDTMIKSYFQKGDGSRVHVSSPFWVIRWFVDVIIVFQCQSWSIHFFFGSFHCPITWWCDLFDITVHALVKIQEIHLNNYKYPELVVPNRNRFLSLVK